jgi:hypothetical protein
MRVVVRFSGVLVALSAQNKNSRKKLLKAKEQEEKRVEQEKKKVLTAKAQAASALKLTLAKQLSSVIKLQETVLNCLNR